MSRTPSAISIFPLVLAILCCEPFDDRQDAGQDYVRDGLDGGSADAGLPFSCDNPAPVPESLCPGCILEERNVETQQQLEAFSSAEHASPYDTVNIFSSVNEPDPIVDLAPLQAAIFTARAVTMTGPSSVPDMVFSGIDARSLVGFGGEGIRSMAFPRMTAMANIMTCCSSELEGLSFPNLEQAGSIKLTNLPSLCDIDLGHVTTADVCDPDRRQYQLDATCAEGPLRVTSCCEVPFE
jgi:hypothetical protein